MLRFSCILWLLCATHWAHSEEAPRTLDDFRSMIAQRAKEHAADLQESRFFPLKNDYFLRFVRDEGLRPDGNEAAIDSNWRIVLPDNASPLARLMAGHLGEFLEKRMNVSLTVALETPAQIDSGADLAIVLLEQDGGDPDIPESFTIRTSKSQIRVIGRDAPGLRDGIVRLVDTIGFRRAPFVAIGKQVYRPRIRLRQGSHGSHRDTVFMGYNAVSAGGGSLYAVSTSDAILELKSRRAPNAFRTSYENTAAARRYGLKTYFHLSTARKFPKNDPVFEAHPDIRGALTWKADGEYTLCTEHPLVRQYLTESVRQIFQTDPKLDGITIIIGGEGFYHCFMRPFGVEKGHTNCSRCEKLGAETVVANLCNRLAAAARQVNPNAEVLAWPYSAAHVWSSDKAQLEFIKRLQPGVTLLTEIVKDEVIEKPNGVRKSLWDYSIDLIGPGDRAKQQIDACDKAGVPIRLLSMIEETFEASLLPHIPCMDRWADRAGALATCGADSVFVFQMGPYDASSAAEINKFFWWDPAPGKDELLEKLAARIAGSKAGPHLRTAWRHVSNAIDFSPEIGPYYKGPHYLGPAHPMCADLEAEVPELFYGYYLFMAELTPEEAFKGRPTFLTSPRGDRAAFQAYYEQMEEQLQRALAEMDLARPNVPEPHRLTFDAEAVSIEWFYRTARSCTNFYKSCHYRDTLLALVKKPKLNDTDRDEARRLYRDWKKTLLDEKENAEAALPLVEADARLDFYHRGDHSFSHTDDMIRAKIELTDDEINNYLPSVAKLLQILGD